MEIITLETNQILFVEVDYMVHQGGDFEPTDLVGVCKLDDTTIPICAYQAHYIKYGVHFGE